MRSTILTSIIGIALATNVARAQSLDLTVQLGTPTSTPEAAVNAALSDFCQRYTGQTGLQSDTARLLEICTLLTDDNQNVDQRVDALTAVSSKSASALDTFAARVPTGYSLSTVRMHLAALRHSLRSTSDEVFGFNFNGVPIPPEQPRVQGGAAGGAVGADESGQRSLFGVVGVADTSHDETTTIMGFDGTNVGLTFGFDYRWSEQTFTGGAVGYQRANLDLSRDSGDISGDSFHALGYLTRYLAADVYFDAVVGLNQGQFDLSRRVAFTVGNTTVNETASTATKLDTISAAATIGYESSGANGINFGYFGTLHYNTSDAGAYDESGTNGLNLHVDGQTVESLLLSAGAQISRPMSRAWGILTPHFTATIIYDAKSDGESIRAHFLSDPDAVSFSYQTKDRDKSYAVLSAGLSTQYQGGTGAFIQIETLAFSEDYQQIVISAGVRKELK